VRTLVLGGIRSGKSQWAETEITESSGDGRQVRYIATGAAPGDDTDWSERVAAHRARRPSHWTTVETADVPTQLRSDTATATLVDDIGGWLTAAVGCFGSPLALVSPEVGLTVVPATPAGRRFADELGSLNQRLATLCNRVVLVIAGQPLTVKDAS
jgi:adenosylcobinamide kinase/adenosylcobinamide-phosphate guanylyltransferase